uniref:Synaptotagmin-like 2a n=1 Tax=Sinocyclocheilus rhinocerous TaxID=307959 RepID=A0A673M6L1_9TELE
MAQSSFTKYFVRFLFQYFFSSICYITLYRRVEFCQWRSETHRLASLTPKPFIMIDLSYLTEEEQEMILAVLKRDAELKKLEEQRIKQLRKTERDRSRLKYLTGEWFYETKNHRHRDRIHGTDIIRASMRQKKPVTIFVQPKTKPPPKPRRGLFALFSRAEKKDKCSEVQASDKEEISQDKTESSEYKTSCTLRPEDDNILPQTSVSTNSKTAEILQEKTDKPICEDPPQRETFDRGEISPGRLVTGSVMSIYSSEFGNVEVKGTIQFAIHYVQKLEEFHIFVVQCKDLAVADVKRNRSDPYVKCYLLPDKAKYGKKKTCVRKKTLDPAYNEILQVPTSPKNSVGSVEMSAEIKGNGEVQIWVKECKNLPITRGVAIDPFVKCAVLPDTSRKSRQKTKVLKRASNPVFNHTMVYDGFRQEDLKEACVELTVWDHDRLKNHFIGGIRLGPGTGKSYGTEVNWMDSNVAEAALWERMMQSPNEWVEDILPLRMMVMARMSR